MTLSSKVIYSVAEVPVSFLLTPFVVNRIQTTQQLIQESSSKNTSSANSSSNNSSHDQYSSSATSSQKQADPWAAIATGT